MRHTLWNRRSFLGALGSTAALAAAPGMVGFTQAESRNLAFVATRNCIHTLRFIDAAWQTAHVTEATQPSALAVSAARKTLYATSAINRSHNLPTGAVTSYRIAQDGSLQATGNAALALAAVRPYALAVSPDSTLLATASEGNIVSLLALAPDGTPGPVVAARKEIAVTPLHLSFNAEGHLTITAADTEATLRVSAEHGFQALSRRPATPKQTTSLDMYNINDARAVATLSA